MHEPHQRWRHFPVPLLPPLDINRVRLIDQFFVHGIFCRHGADGQTPHHCILAIW